MSTLFFVVCMMSICLSIAGVITFLIVEPSKALSIGLAVYLIIYAITGAVVADHFEKYESSKEYAEMLMRQATTE